MKIRPVILSVLLSVLLLVSQQAAVAHAVGHLGSSSQSSSSHDKELPVEQTCHQCLAFLSIGSALTGSPLDLPFDHAGHARLATDQRKPFIPENVRLFDSRAPPVPHR